MLRDLCRARYLYNLKVALHAALSLGFCLGAAAQPSAPYVCGFEAPDYQAGNFPQNGWSSEVGTSASIQHGSVYEAQAALAVDVGGAVNRTIAPTGGVIWVDGYQKANGYEALPDLSVLSEGAAIIAFHTSGVVCLNGAGDGTGIWIETGAAFDADAWVRVTLRLDYGAQTYDCHVNGAQVATGLGFLHDTTTELNGLQITTGDSISLVDCLSVSDSEPDGLGETAPGPDPARAFSYRLSEQGWASAQFYSFSGATVVVATTDSGRLVISSSEFFSSGLWGSGGQVVPSSSDSVYELRWNVASDQTDAANAPWLRLRANTDSGQVANVMHVISPGAGAFSPDTGGRVYQQIFELPAPVADEGFNLSFDLLQFNADDLVGAELSLNSVDVLRHDASGFAGGVEVASYDFSDGAQGWSFAPLSIIGATAPTSQVVAGTGLSILSHSNDFTAAWWESPTTTIGASALPAIYRADLEVSAAVATVSLPPVMRLRLFDATSGYQTVEMQTSPSGDALASPGSTPRLYSVYLFAPAGVGFDNGSIGMSMDLLNISADYDPTAIFTLESASLYEIGL